MTGYLINFSIYTLAMVGVIFVALFVFKTFSNKCFSKKSSMLGIEDSMNLSPRKTLYVIKVEDERFLIAADVDRTSLVAKLDGNSQCVKPVREDKSSSLSSFDGIDSLSEFASIIDFQKKNSLREGSKNLDKGPMMKELAKKLSAI